MINAVLVYHPAEMNHWLMWFAFNQIHVLLIFISWI